MWAFLLINNFVVCLQADKPWVLTLSAGFSLGVQIHQSPSEFIRKAGENEQLHCTHGDSAYRVMLWYQQLPEDKALKLIGYGYVQFNNDSVEEAFREQFRLAGDLSSTKKKGTLFITNLNELKHNAVYFCAAREAQYTKHPPALNQKPSNPSFLNVG